METLGSLCDKLTIVKLKQWHTEDITRLDSLAKQETQLSNEIDSYLFNAFNGDIPLENLIFSSNKVYKTKGNEIREISGTSIGAVFAELSQVNCNLWHEQEKVYEFEVVPVEQKNVVVKNLAKMNLERNSCIDKIDSLFYSFIDSIKK
jgi:hypothetical protein